MDDEKRGGLARVMTCDCLRVCNCGESIWIDEDGRFYRQRVLKGADPLNPFGDYEPATFQEVAAFAVEHRQPEFFINFFLMHDKSCVHRPVVLVNVVLDRTMSFADYDAALSTIMERAEKNA